MRGTFTNWRYVMSGETTAKACGGDTRIWWLMVLRQTAHVPDVTVLDCIWCCCVKITKMSTACKGYVMSDNMQMGEKQHHWVAQRQREKVGYHVDGGWHGHGVTQSSWQKTGVRNVKRMDVTEDRCHRRELPQRGWMSQKIGAIGENCHREDGCHRRYVP